MPSSNVVAAVLGIAINGPRQIALAVRRIADSFLPITSVIPSIPLPVRASIIRANTARPTSVSRKQQKAVNHWFDVLKPRYGGKIRLPAPKNMANRAKPMTKTFLKCCFLSIIVYLSFLQSVFWWILSNKCRLTHIHLVNIYYYYIL